MSSQDTEVTDSQNVTGSHSFPVFHKTESSNVDASDDIDEYFAGYAEINVHEVMLRDWPRMAAYRRFFEENQYLIKDKIVMDVGAGTGILSLFAASVGAKKVYAVEGSRTSILCKEIVNQNGFGDVIEVIHSRVENLQLLGVKVDIMVSEWMGFYLLHESMLDSLIIARDKFLAKDGLMVPTKAQLYLAPVNLEAYLAEKFEFWTNVCGFDFTAVIPRLRQKFVQEPLTLALDQHQVVASPQIIAEFHLKTVKLADVQVIKQKLTFNLQMPTKVHGFALWFDVDFKVYNAPDSKTGKKAGGDKWTVIPPTILSTSPAAPVTHWKQTVIMLPRTLSIDAGDSFSCCVVMAQAPMNKRHYNITLEMVEDFTCEIDDDVCADFDEEEHPTPCDCGRAKCRLIKALMEKYDQEQDALEMKANVVSIHAEVNSANVVGEEIVDDECF